jgi:hypothetical protein
MAHRGTIAVGHSCPDESPATPALESLRLERKKEMREEIKMRKEGNGKVICRGYCSGFYIICSITFTVTASVV